MIVGFSYAGLTLVSALQDLYKITVIDQNDYFEHICTNFKSFVDEDFPDRILRPLEKTAQSFDKIDFLQATLLNVNLDDTVTVQLKDGTSESVQFDYLVLCTGFSYSKPIKDASALTLGDRKKSLKEFNAQIAKAKSVLVAGAGVVGVELVGELAVKYGKEKKIGICLRGDRLLHSFPPKAGRLADE